MSVCASYSVKIGLATDWSLRFYALALVSAFFVLLGKFLGGVL